MLSNRNRILNLLPPPHTRHNWVNNLSDVHFSMEQPHTMNLGLNFATEQTPQNFLNILIVETENAI
jgi:hypothetical protein